MVGVARPGYVVPAKALITFLMKASFSFRFRRKMTVQRNDSNFLVFVHPQANLKILMSVYARFKRDHDGFRKLVELLESTPASRRQKMIDVGMEEDADYTTKAMQYILDFQDIIDLPEMELAEVCAKAPPRMIAYAISQLSQDVQDRFLKVCKPKVLGEVRDLMVVQVGLREIGGAQIRVIESARELERAGYVRTKRIPVGGAVAEE
jgi:flagellar motor switch protein FliG